MEGVPIKGGVNNIEEIKSLQKKIQDLEKRDGGLNDFFEYASKQIAARFLSKVIQRTPVEQNRTIRYKTAGGLVGTKVIKGGALRRAWTGGKENEVDFINEARVVKRNSVFQITISNNEEYASYVEYGHRQNVGQFVPWLGEKNDKGIVEGATLQEDWVDGKFMMERSADEIKAMAPALANKLIREYLFKHFG